MNRRGGSFFCSKGVVDRVPDVRSTRTLVFLVCSSEEYEHEPRFPKLTFAPRLSARFSDPLLGWARGHFGMREPVRGKIQRTVPYFWATMGHGMNHRSRNLRTAIAGGVLFRGARSFEGVERTAVPIEPTKQPASHPAGERWLDPSTNWQYALSLSRSLAGHGFECPRSSWRT